MAVYIVHLKCENTRMPKILAYKRDKVVIHQNHSPTAFCFRVFFSLSSLLFLTLFSLLNTPFEDDNSRDAWLSLIALKRKVDSLVLGQLQVVLMF